MSENTQSQTLLYPVLEDDVIMCPHGGKVQLKSIKGKPFKSDGVPIILEPDMQNALISGCTNNILGVPTPCTMVVNIPPAALSLKTLNGEKAVMQDYVSLIMTDKGFPLQIIPKPNKWKLAYSAPQSSSSENNSEENEKEKIQHILHIRHCLSDDYNNTLDGIYDVLIYNSSVENSNAEVTKLDFHNYNFNNPVNISLGKSDKSDEGIYPKLLEYLRENYTEKIYSYKAVTVEIGNNIFEYIFLGLKKKKYESSFGFLMTGSKFIRIDNNRENCSNKPIITEIVKTSFMVECIDLVIS